MKFPLSIPDSMPVKDFLRQMLNHLRASKVISINGIPGQESPNGTRFNIPVGNTTVAGGGGCTAFRLAVSDEDKFTVTESTVAGLTPSGFTGGLQEFTVTLDDGVVYAVLVINSAGTPVSATVEQAASLPADTATELHRQIGTFHVEDPEDTAVLSVTQTNCGPFEATICRNWFAAEAPFFGVTWS